MRSIYEKKVQKKLEDEGYFVDWKIRPRFGRGTYNTDFFGLFDLIAIRPGDPIRWIAVKGKQGNYSPLRVKIRKFWMPEGNIKELWRYPKGKKSEPKIENLNEKTTPA